MGKADEGDQSEMKSRASLIAGLLQAGNDPNQILFKLSVRQALRGCKTVLDVGCGTSPLMRQLGVKEAVGFDGYAPSIEKAKQLKTHDEYVLGDVRRLGDYFSAGQFDACVACDVIEHLEKPDGLKLAADMEKIAARRVIFFTPSGYLPQRHTDNDDLQEHLSGWEASEMRQMGYEVTGQLGPKILRGEYHRLKYKPRAFWSIVSFLGQTAWCKNKPEKSAAIFCVKNIS